MFNFDTNNYLNNIAQTPKEHHHDLLQASIDSQWENTTLLKTIKEEHYPFDDEYDEYDVWLDTISDVTVNTFKVIGNYISVMFKNIDHPRNYRGQKYKWTETDRDYESTYLCYDMISSTVGVAETKLIKCNNSIKIIDKKNGNIHEEPIFVGWEITSTNNQQNKDGIIENRRLVCLMQKNKYTSGIVENQRFMTSKRMAFKVTQIDDTNEENYQDDFCTMYNLFIEWTPILKDRDNLELCIADYYDNIYQLNINQENNIEQVNGFVGKLEATVKLNNEIIDIPINWTSSNNNVVKIDNKGNYTIVGNNGQNATIKCSLNGNEKVYDEIKVKVVNDFLPDKVLNIYPKISELKQNMEHEFICNVYINGQKQTDLVVCSANWEDDKYYKLESTLKGYKIKNIHSCKDILTLKFTSGSLEESIDIKLGGLF